MRGSKKKVVKVGGTILLLDQAEKLEGDILHDNLTMLSLDSQSGCLFGLALTGELLAFKMASDERVATIVEAEEDLATHWLSFSGFIRMDGRKVSLDPRVVALVAKHASVGRAAPYVITKNEAGFSFLPAESGDEVTIVSVDDLHYLIFDRGDYTLVGELTFGDDGTCSVGTRLGAVGPDDSQALMEVDTLFLSTLGRGWREVPGPGLDRLAG